MIPRLDRPPRLLLVATLAASLAACSSARPSEPIQLSTSYKAGTWCITVTNSRKPIRVELENKTPDRHRLDRGRIQKAVTSGGKPNRLCRNAQRIGPGPGLLAVRVLDETSSGHDESQAASYQPNSTRAPQSTGPTGPPATPATPATQGSTPSATSARSPTGPPATHHWRSRRDPVQSQESRPEKKQKEQKEQKEQKKQRQRAEELTRRLAGRIPPILAEFRQGRANLPEKIRRKLNPSEVYERKKVEQLLDRTEADVDQTLGRAPELAALRDRMESVFQQARRELATDPGRAGLARRALPVQANPALAAGFRATGSMRNGLVSSLPPAFASRPGTPLPPAQIQLAASAAPARDRGGSLRWVAIEIARIALDQVEQFLEQLDQQVAADRLTLPVVVRSGPDSGYWFHLFPRSAPRNRHQERTDYQIPALYLGLYQIEAGAGDDPGADVDCQAAGIYCGPIDLWDNPDPILCCFLDSATYCRRITEVTERCTPDEL